MILEEATINTALTIIGKLYTLTKEMNETYQTVDEDYKALQDLAGKVTDTLYNASITKGISWDNPTLTQMYVTLDQAYNFLDYYHSVERKYTEVERPRIQIMGHAIKKYVYYAPEYKNKFNTCIDTLYKIQQKIIEEKKTVKELSKQAYFAHRQELEKISHELSEFWYGTSGGKDTCDWTTFVNCYKETYETDDWSGEDWTCLKLAIGVASNGKMEVNGLMIVTRKTDFPIKKEKLPSTLDSETAMDTTSLIEVGKMINSMIRLLASEKMDDHMHHVKHWYEKNKRLSKENAANKLYRRYVDYRKKNEPYHKPTEEEQLIYDVEKARRDFSHFYQELRVIVRFSGLSRSKFHSINFPGARNIKQYIDYFKPLDAAYNSIVIGLTNFVETNDDGMDLYTFLDEFLDYEKMSKELDEIMRSDNRLLRLKMAEDELEKMKLELEDKKNELQKRLDDLEIKEKKLEDKFNKPIEGKKDKNEKQGNLEKKEKDINEKQESLEKEKEKPENGDKKDGIFNRAINKLKDKSKNMEGKANQTKPEQEIFEVKHEQAKPEVKPEQVKIEQKKAEDIKAKEIKAEEIKAEEAKAKKIKNEQEKTVPINTKPGYIVEELVFDIDDDSGIEANNKIYENTSGLPPIAVN